MKNHTNTKLSQFGLSLLILFAGMLTASAQLLNPNAQQTVREIGLEFVDVQTVSEEAVMAHVIIKEDMEYNQSLVDQSIRSLYETGLYQFIQVRREPLPGGGLRLVFEIQTKFRIKEIIYQGNQKVSESKLEELTALQPGHSLDEVKIKIGMDAIKDYYIEKGYSDVQVNFGITKNDDTGAGTVIYTISEGGKIRIADIDFTGNTAFSEGELEDVFVHTSERNFISWITGSGRFNQELFQDDLEFLRDFYKDAGYLDVEIPESGVQISYPDPDRMVINVTIEEGRVYKLGTVTISGNELYDTPTLMNQLNLKTGDVFSPSKVDMDAEAIRDYYGQQGYLDTFVRKERTPNLETGKIDLNYAVRESEKFFVESVEIDGNNKTKSTVILREIALAPGDVFDLVRMKKSQRRLQNTGFFEEVNLAPETTNVPGRRNLRITVKEGRTGNLTFGAGFSSVEKAVIFTEVTQSNFDLFNYRSMFQGDGQKFRLRLSLGSSSNQILLSFEEPWVFERELAAGFEIFRTESDFNSSVYDELRTGFELYARKRLFELVEGRISYRFEMVDIFDIDRDEVSSAILEEEGETTVSKVGFTLLRDTRDSLSLPTRGNRMQFITEYAGLGGEVDYIRLEGKAGQWWPVSKRFNQIFSLIGRAGTIIPQDGSRVPFFDRYFLGGPNSLRGFDYREVGPKDSKEEPIGGNTYGFLSAEYSLEVYDPLRMAVFYDIGFLNSDDTDWDVGDYNDNWGFGFRIEVLGAPLRIDLGFPITADDFNDDGMQFNFSFGTAF